MMTQFLWAKIVYDDGIVYHTNNHYMNLEWGNNSCPNINDYGPTLWEYSEKFNPFV